VNNPEEQVAFEIVSASVSEMDSRTHAYCEVTVPDGQRPPFNELLRCSRTGAVWEATSNLRRGGFPNPNPSIRECPLYLVAGSADLVEGDVLVLEVPTGKDEVECRFAGATVGVFPDGLPAAQTVAKFRWRRSVDATPVRMVLGVLDDVPCIVVDGGAEFVCSVANTDTYNTLRIISVRPRLETLDPGWISRAAAGAKLLRRVAASLVPDLDTRSLLPDALQSASDIDHLEQSADATLNELRDVLPIGGIRVNPCASG
jgi:hypothetical protein